MSIFEMADPIVGDGRRPAAAAAADPVSDPTTLAAHPPPRSGPSPELVREVESAEIGPCRACGSPLAWLTAYGEVSCWECLPPPAAGLVKCRLALVSIWGGLAWEIHPPGRWAPER